MKALSIVMVMLATPAYGHCYSVWKYKTPQHCFAGTSAIVKHVRPKSHEPERHYIIHFQKPEVQTEIKELHVNLEDIERAEGLQKLKELMK